MPRHQTVNGSLRQRIVDETMDAYVAWREECIRVWDAYHLYRGAPSADSALAFGTYLAAVDREERASEVYAGWIRRLMPLVEARPVDVGV